MITELQEEVLLLLNEPKELTVMAKPKGIQLKRTRGYRKPSNAIVVSRPSRWGNPFRVGDPGARLAVLSDLDRQLLPSELAEFHALRLILRQGLFSRITLDKR